jgi:CHAT domain-containing protein
MSAAVCLAAIAASPAAAESYSYQGQMQIQTSPGDVCLDGSETVFNINIYGRDDAPMLRFDGYLSGEKIVHAHFSGNDLSRLALAYVGESAPSHTLSLRVVGNGEFVGELQAVTLLSAMRGCKPFTARIRFSKTGTHTQADFERAANLYQVDSRASQAYNQGIQAGARGRIKEALPVVQQALEINEKALGPADPKMLAYYYYMAQLHLVEGSYREESDLDRKALAVCEHAYGADSRCTGLMLTVLASALSKTGDYAEAESDAHRALAICKAQFGPEGALTATNLNSLGVVLIYTGRYGEAEATLNRALALDKTVFGPNDANLGVTLNNLAALYRFTGQYKKAETAIRQALAIDTKALGADSPLTIINTIVLAQILRVSGQNDAAEAPARQALATAKKVLGPERPDHPALSMALSTLAEVLRESGRYAEAEPLYRQALANSQKYLGPDNPDIATLSLELAKLLRATGRDPEALTLLKSAYRIAHISGNQMVTWRVPGELMLLYASAKPPQPDIAIFFGKEAVNTLQQLRGNLADSGNEAQQAFVSAAEVKAVYRGLADLLVTQNRLSEAQQVLAMIKEQELFDFSQRTADAGVRRTTATLNTSEKDLDDLGAKDVALGKEYGALQEKLQKQHDLAPADRNRLNTLRNEMDAAQTKFESRVAAVAKSSADPEAQKRRRQEINDYSRAFEGTLKDMGHDAVLAQYFILDDHVEILLTTPNVVIARQAPIKRADLNAQILAYRKTLSAPDRDPLPQAQALYRVLMEPIAADLRQAGARTLMLSLDDTLRYLPFAALHDGKNYVIETLSLVMVTEAVRDKLGKAPATDWSVWGLGVTQGGADYPALPYVGVELNGITGPKGILTGQVLLDKAFNEGSLRDGLDRSFPIIHIASHFQFTPGSMDDSFLLLGDGSRMTLAQIKNKLDFKNVELLTLSACETAVGDDSVAHHGDEVEGLGAIAQEAGAKAVLATLWPVADSSTALLMRTLYKAHKEQHVDKADALREAQLGLLHGTAQADAASQGQRGLTRIAASSTAGGAVAPGDRFKIDPAAPFAHPFFWAPFILMGNWL